MDIIQIKKQVHDGLMDLLQAAQLRPGDLFVIGCSTSEVNGHRIGTQSSEEAAAAIMGVLRPVLDERGLFLAVQCCEHLNRALVVEQAALERFGLTKVWVEPWLHAGGAMATHAFSTFREPVVVEDVKAQASAGMDIGGTFIGMHLHPVVVPIHTDHKRVGAAVLTMARTRPRYIGGPRARYAPVEAH